MPFAPRGRRVITKAVAAGPLIAVLAVGAGAAETGGPLDCPGASAPARAQGRTAAASAVNCLVNAARAQGGARPLRPSSRLDLAAGRHTWAMIRTGVIDHRVPGEAPLRTRVSVTGYFKRSRGADAGEVLSWTGDGQATPQGLVTALLSSPAHREVLLNRSFRDIGAGLAWAAGPATGPGAGVTILTVDLGTDR